MNRKDLLPVLLVPACILLIPGVAMLIQADGWQWSASDFILMWVLMAGVGLAYKLVTRRAGNAAYRIAAGMALGTAFLLVWVNGAVGLIGSEDNPANALYGGVLLVGLIGSALARFAPVGMARAMFAMAAAQFLVPVIALVRWGHDFSPGVVQVFGLNFVFVLLFATAGLLFRQAGGRPGSVGGHAAA